MEEESFEVRVKRLFGSTLFETVPKSAFPTTSWSVADGEVERREWNRDRGGDDDPAADREDNPCSSAFYDNGVCFKAERRRDRKKEFEGNLGDLEDDGEEDDDNDGGKREGKDGGDDVGFDGEREEQEIRSSVGLDPTLDNEEEEDVYDILALCRENAGERLYMRDIKDNGPYLNCHAAVPELFVDSLEEVNYLHKDPRADHFAASLRLKEDKQESGSGPVLYTRTDKDPSIDLRAKVTEDVNVKPILKRKEGRIHSKPNKRVRFDPACIDVHDAPFEEPTDLHTVLQSSMETTAVAEVNSSLPEDSAGVPDYVRNPSKYTCYTFDSSGDDVETNKSAFEDFRNLMKKSNKEDSQPEFPMELPTTVTFTPRKKTRDAMQIDDGSELAQLVSCKETGQMLTCSAFISAGEAKDSEACEMEEDDAETPIVEANLSSRKGRRYRSKSNPEDSS